MSPDDDRSDTAQGSLADRARAWIDEVLDATGTTGRALLGGALAVGVGVGALLWLTRQAPPPVESGLPLIEPSSVTTSPTTTEPPGPVVVHVAGAVNSAGVFELPAGARVIDAVDAAGGLAADAEAGRVNLAAEVVDGAQIYVPAVGETPPVVTGAGPADDGTEGGLVNINTATAAQLDALPGIGPATAAAIIDHRERNGPFASPDGLLDVRGIGEAKLAQLREMVVT